MSYDSRGGAATGRSQDAYARHMDSQGGGGGGAPQTAASMQLGMGAPVIYKQIGKAGLESMAVVIEIASPASRKVL